MKDLKEKYKRGINYSTYDTLTYKEDNFNVVISFSLSYNDEAIVILRNIGINIIEDDDYGFDIPYSEKNLELLLDIFKEYKLTFIEIKTRFINNILTIDKMFFYKKNTDDIYHQKINNTKAYAIHSYGDIITIDILGYRKKHNPNKPFELISINSYLRKVKLSDLNKQLIIDDIKEILNTDIKVISFKIKYDVDVKEFIIYQMKFQLKNVEK